MLRYFKKVEKSSHSDVPGLSLEQKERADQEVQRAIEKQAEKRSKYNDYTPEIGAKIGKCAAENGPTRASRESFHPGT